ncbi:potassium channel family protein [Kitasatospora purpeofusca]|uniref:potassium channel family protein n=1 Tax=Kitasatospora purpeofusca TaxID=67352 RepID=UPI002252E960|nr:potassium channel family protein [Kitasatospora purpeofusca]MCX4757172.1 potassium channel family protein [Kitasatospora purpeofusca]WSR35068.1 potassium channel family protein [Kitasatospora purpeofusca]WSR43391.1 potassium channel family protein [Kitasatospora purpeofusca]
MDWLVTVLGALLVLLVLRDVFHTLWHPTRHGGLSRLVMTAAWRLTSHLSTHRRAAGLAGPLAMVSVVALWASAATIGWALVYWPHMPVSFTYATGLDPADHAGFVDALYVSLVNLTTLGLGDIAPTAGWLRIVAPIEALVGFALLSATVSWIIGIYPALARRRALALRLSHLRRSRPTTGLSGAIAGATLLDSLSREVAVVSVDFMQYAESYYFYDGNDRTSLPAQIGDAVEQADQAAAAAHPEVRHSGSALKAALEDLAAILDERFLHTHGTPKQTFEAYARDHGRQSGSAG